MLLRSLAVLLLIPVVAMPQTRTASPSRGNQGTQAREYANGAEGFAYANAFIDSLAWAKSGQSRLKTVDAKTEFTDMLYNFKLANQDYEKGAAVVAPFSKSPVKTIQLSSSATQGIFEEVIEANKETMSLFTAIMDGKGPQGMGTLANQVSDNMVKVDNAWKLLVTASIAATYVLLEPEPTTHRMRLNVTAAQRDQLAASLERTFGANQLKDGLK